MTLSLSSARGSVETAASSLAGAAVDNVRSIGRRAHDTVQAINGIMAMSAGLQDQFRWLGVTVRQFIASVEVA
jgi:hypothetical protein